MTMGPPIRLSPWRGPIRCRPSTIQVTRGRCRRRRRTAGARSTWPCSRRRAPPFRPFPSPCCRPSGATGSSTPPRRPARPSTTSRSHCLRRSPGSVARAPSCGWGRAGTSRWCCGRCWSVRRRAASRRRWCRCASCSLRSTPSRPTTTLPARSSPRRRSASLPTPSRPIRAVSCCGATIRRHGCALTPCARPGCRPGRRARCRSAKLRWEGAQRGRAHAASIALP